MISICRSMLCVCAALCLVLAAPLAAKDALRVLAMGDSLMAAHGASERAIADVAGRALGIEVQDRSVIGARMIYKLPISGSMGFNISKQFRDGSWDWIVLNGGGNDLWLGCGCNKCARKMDRMITADGASGEITTLVSKLRKTGARVVYVGYLRSPGIKTPIEHCKDEGDELEARITQLANADKGVFFVSLADLVPSGDRSYFGADLIHPSLKASREIGLRVAQVIAKN